MKAWTRHEVRMLLWCLNPLAPQAALHALLKRTGAKQLGSGCYRTGFRLGNFVVKWKDPDQPIEPHEDVLKFAKLFKVQLAKTEVVNGWLLQEYYRPITLRQWARLIEDPADAMGNDYWNACADFNANNLGWDKQRRLIAFDW
jgi:hypothetical protein